MKFSNTVRRREVVFMIRLLTIFGVVEQRQMRLLFDHMSNRPMARSSHVSGKRVWPISRRTANSSQQVDTH